MKKIISNIALTVALLGFAALAVGAEVKKVTAETYIRAETDRTFAGTIKLAGGTNKFFHFRNLTPLDKQTVVRMNRDVLYSAGIFDAKEGLTVSVPRMPDGRYASIYVIDNDHYVVDIIHEPGEHKVKGNTNFLGLIVRIQVNDPSDKKEIAMINSLQDKFTVISKTNGEFPGFKWDGTSLDSLKTRYEKEYTKNYSSYAGMMGKRGKVKEKIRHLAAATGWGLFPEEEATYLAYKGESKADVCYKATYAIPENKGFWSITVYGSDAYMKSDNNILNETNVKLNDDGTFTAYFGSEAVCGKVANRVDTTDGWNFLLRIYRPGQSVLAGKYKVPSAIAVPKGN